MDDWIEWIDKPLVGKLTGLACIEDSPCLLCPVNWLAAVPGLVEMWEQPPHPTGSSVVRFKCGEKTWPERLLYSDAAHQTTLDIKENKHKQLHFSFIAQHSQNPYLMLKEKFKIWSWHTNVYWSLKNRCVFIYSGLWAPNKHYLQNLRKSY